ncbi:MAG: SRPBCC family protein [Lysobacterales bacterium]
MSIHYEHSVTVQSTPALAFAAIDDLPLTAQWLPPCVSLTKVGVGPNAPGDLLRYMYRQGGREQVMDGQILDRVPGQRLHCRYADRTFEVLVDLQVAPLPAGARITHRVTIIPATLVGRLMQPLIRLGLGKQTRDAATNLKRLLESTPGCT